MPPHSELCCSREQKKEGERNRAASAMEYLQRANDISAIRRRAD